MMLKMIGAGMILAGCAGYGFSIALRHRKETVVLREVQAALEQMICELEYRRTPLRELCLDASVRSGVTGRVFKDMATMLDTGERVDASECMKLTLNKQKELPGRVEAIFRELGSSLGRFSLSGQVAELKAAAESCRRELKGLEAGQEERLRSYRTLGLCAGAALVILFV